MLSNRNRIIPFGLFVFVVLTQTIFSCTDIYRKKMSIGSISDTNKKHKSVLTIFESNNAKEGLRLLDSILSNTPDPTVIDYVVYYNIHSHFSSWTGEYYKQISYADSAINLVDAYDCEKETADLLVGSYSNKAYAYYSLLNLEAGNAAFFKSYTIAEQYGDVNSKATLANNIAMQMYQQQLYDTAITYFKYALQHNLVNPIEIPHRNNKTQELLDNIGLCYTKLNQPDSALHYYKLCIHFLQQPDTKLGIDSANNRLRKAAALGVVHGNMAKVYVYTHKIDSAILLFKKAIDYNNIPGADTRDMQMCMLQLGNIYVSQKNASALYPLIKALKQSFAISTTLHIRAETEKLEYHYFGLLNKPALALPKLEQSLALKDSLALLESSTIKQDITKELKDREQQLQISLLTKSNELSKSYTWFFAILAITTAAILLLVFYNYKQQKQNLNKQAQLNAAIMAQKTEIEGSLQKAYDANKARENVIQIMAHELRSPISGIAAISGTLLQNDGMNPSEQNELIALIEGTATKSYHLINELIETNSTRKLQLTKRQFDVKKLLEETINLLQFKAQDKKQVIQLHAPDGSIMVTADEEKMGRVFSNLLTNAIKFSPLQEKIRVTITPNSGYLQVAVIDNGKGIPQSQLKNIFNLFTSAQQTGTAGEKSFGIGLSVCKQIVEAHGGHIEVISTEGKGSTFTVQLPLTDNV